MRKDPLKGETLEQSPAFDQSTRDAVATLDRSSSGEHSLSGHEPNRFFSNHLGSRFDDLSGLSGMDHPGDGRSVVRWDPNHDGWPDLATINANGPKLLWFENQMGDLFQEANQPRTFLTLRFEGGARADGAAGLSNRDGYGVKVEAEIGEDKLLRETRCGEGFSAQNSRTLILGLGNASKVDRLTIHWPSGRQQVIEDVEAGHLLTIQESPAEGEKAWTASAY